MHMILTFLDVILGDVGETYSVGRSLAVLPLSLVFLISYLAAILIYFRKDLELKNLKILLYTKVAFFILLLSYAFFGVSHSLALLMIILYLFLITLLLVGITIKDIIFKSEYKYLAKVSLLILIVFVVLGMDGGMLSQFLLNGVIVFFVAWIFLLLPFLSFQSYFKVKKRTNLYASIILLLFYVYSFWGLMGFLFTPMCCGLD